MNGYYYNLTRHLTDEEEGEIDAIVAKGTGRPNAGIGYPPRHESPRVWLEECDDWTARALTAALTRIGVIAH